MSFIPAPSRSAFSTSTPFPETLISRRVDRRFIEISPLTLPSKTFVLKFLIKKMFLAREIPAVVFLTSMFPVIILAKSIEPF